MPNPKIKFSHPYFKLYGQTSAILLRVETANRNELSDAFIEYDTAYPGGNYPLHPGEYIVLTFLGCYRIPFTTVRPWNFDKETYYRRRVGWAFDIVYLEPPSTKE